MKKFLICLSIFCSFLFISNVKAVTYQGITVDEALINRLWSAFDGKSLQSSDINKGSGVTNDTYTETFKQEDFPYFTISKTTRSSGYYSFMFIYNTNGQASEPNQYNRITLNTQSYRLTGNYYPNTGVINFLYFYDGYSQLYTADSSFYYYKKSATNFNVYNNDTLLIEKTIDYDPNPLPYTFNFHLNDGWVYDSVNNFGSEEDFSITLYEEEIDDFFENLQFNKATMIFDGLYYDSNFTEPFNLLTDNLEEHSYTENGNKYVDLYVKWILPDYLTGYKKITLTTDDKYYMLSGLSSGSVYIPTSDFETYGGRLSYYDNDLNSQPYTSYIQDYYKMSDGMYIRQDFDLSQYYGADWVMFSKYIYLEGEDNISYDIYVPDDIYEELAHLGAVSVKQLRKIFVYLDKERHIILHKSYGHHVYDLVKKLAYVVLGGYDDDIGILGI